MVNSKRIVKSFVNVVNALLVLPLLTIVFASPASADTIYTYTGNAFDSFHGNFACPPECKITGSFTLAQTLSPNLSMVTLHPKSFNFTDGAVTLTQGNSFRFISPQFGDFSTDSTGAITAWAIRIQGVRSLGFPGLGSINEGCVIKDETLVLLKVGASNTDNPGTWFVPTTSTPEPSCFLLLLTGLVGIRGAKRIGLQTSIAR